MATSPPNTPERSFMSRSIWAAVGAGVFVLTLGLPRRWPRALAHPCGPLPPTPSLLPPPDRPPPRRRAYAGAGPP